MRVHLGAGWNLHHLTDRVIELRKEDAVYRRMLGRDGYVRVRAEPGMDRNGLISKAVEVAKRNDERLGEILAQQIVPRRASYQVEQRRLAPAFGTLEDPEVIGVKRA